MGFAPSVAKDPGFFGPGSVTWRVHGDFTTMLVGGVGALLLQMLHPAALAGVWDHSDFRRDMHGRLRRTAHFLSGTTFGSTMQALELVARVRSIHDLVTGRLPDGNAYSANDPDLLTWVHIAGSWCFLQSFVRYGSHVGVRDRDRYFEETAVIAKLLGANTVPLTLHQARDYLLDMKPQLRADARTRAVSKALLSQPAPELHQEPLRRLVMNGGISLLPDWAAHMHGLEASRTRTPQEITIRGVRHLLRWALQTNGQNS